MFVVTIDLMDLIGIAIGGVLAVVLLGWYAWACIKDRLERRKKE